MDDQAFRSGTPQQLSSFIEPSNRDTGSLQTRIQDMRRNPEDIRKKNAEHAARMGVDPDATMKKWGLKRDQTVTIVRPSVAGSPTPASLLGADMQMIDAVSPSDQGDVSSSGMDLQEDDAPKSVKIQTRVPQQETSVQKEQTKSYKLETRKTKNNSRKERVSEGKEQVDADVTSISKKSITASKRLSPVDVFAESSEIDAAGKASNSSTTPVDGTHSLFVSQVDKYPVLDLPQWYKEITASNFKMKEIAKKRPRCLTQLEILKNRMRLCEDLMKSAKQTDKRKLPELLDQLRNDVHKADFLLGVDKYVVKSARILSVESGLPRIFGENTGFPWYLKADAYQLYAKWMREDFSGDIFRGIVTVQGPNRGSDRLDPVYKETYPVNAKHYGDGGLVLGQCWPTQLCTVRDGAHGSSQGGIFGEKDKGAYSIVLSGGGGYHDKDDGDTIVYSGTEGRDSTPTEATQQMIVSHALGNEIRVIRSHQLPQKNKYRPAIGLRYDGLYTIKSKELVDKEKQIHLFTLERVPGQENIRCGNNAASRPSSVEIKEHKEARKKL